MSSFHHMPDHSRVWVYQANRALASAEVIELRQRASDFLLQWNAHGAKLTAAIEVFYDQFIVIAVDEEFAGASGCSIDSSVRFVQDMERLFNISLMDRMLLAYKQGDAVHVEKMADFEAKIVAGEISGETIVFNNLVANKGEFSAKWEVPMSESWHARMLA